MITPENLTTADFLRAGDMVMDGTIFTIPLEVKSTPIHQNKTRSATHQVSSSPVVHPAAHDGKILNPELCMNIILSYLENEDAKGIFTRDDAPAKIRNFSKKISKQLGLKHSASQLEQEIIVLFDETVFGSGDKGVALTPNGILSNIDSVFMSKYENILSCELSGILNKELIIKSKGRGIYKGILTQGNSGAEFIWKCVSNIISRQ